MLAFGIVFELPLVLTFLAQLGAHHLSKFKKKAPNGARRHVDSCHVPHSRRGHLHSPIILGVAMSILFELTIIFIRITKH